MDKQELHNEDPLRSYINPERIEKAPEGFTLKVMTQIEKGMVPSKSLRQDRKRSLVPYISSGLILALTCAALLLPGSESISLTIPAMEFFKNAMSILSDFDLGSIFNINVPSIINYGLIGILLLSVLDKALYGVFHREK